MTMSTPHSPRGQKTGQRKDTRPVTASLVLPPFPMLPPAGSRPAHLFSTHILFFTVCSGHYSPGFSSEKILSFLVLLLCFFSFWYPKLKTDVRT